MIAMPDRTTGRPDDTVAEQLLNRADWLDSTDRALLHAVLARGVSTASLAEVAGVSQRTIQRRVAQLRDRLNDPSVLAVLRRHPLWPARTAAVAMSVVVRGRTYHQAAHELGLTYHTVRQQMQQVRALVGIERHAHAQ